MASGVELLGKLHQVNPKNPKTSLQELINLSPSHSGVAHKLSRTQYAAYQQLWEERWRETLRLTPYKWHHNAAICLRATPTFMLLQLLKAALQSAGFTLLCTFVTSGLDPSIRLPLSGGIFVLTASMIYTGATSDHRSAAQDLGGRLTVLGIIWAKQKRRKPDV